ncbi:hypothetical protein UFOVP274_73 [uncultured Caudovirales phage]|uniref:Uncharacterized protein n=1 Tax=uncultured Caudovirales phage TaxID=2100421 RepID=A0A6J5LT15_9CAUD|nr:hypothetical protein UFOVP274_73 [uncultured Caudovirales phage]
MKSKIHAATGTMPTEEEITAHTQIDYNAEIYDAAYEVLKAWDTRAGIAEATKAFEALRKALNDIPI